MFPCSIQNLENTNLIYNSRNYISGCLPMGAGVGKNVTYRIKGSLGDKGENAKLKQESYHI